MKKRVVWFSLCISLFFEIGQTSVEANPTLQGLHFTNSSSGVYTYVTVPGTADLESDVLTVEGWVNLDSLNHDQTLLSKAENGGYGIEYSPVTKKWRWSVYINGGYRIVNADQEAKKGEWVHVAGVYDGNQLRFYINGIQQSNVIDISGAVKDTPNVTIGIGENPDSINPGINRLLGWITNVRLWHIARTADEIRFDMEHTLTGNETGLMGDWIFTPYTTKTVYDRTSFHRDGNVSQAKEVFLHPNVKTTHLNHITIGWNKIPDATYVVKRNGVLLSNGVSGDTFTDESVTAENTYTYSVKALTTEGESIEEPVNATADLPYSMPFDGVDDIIRADDAPQFQPAKVTMEVWIKPVKWGTMTRAFIAKRTSTHNGYMFFYDAAAGTVHVDWGGFTQRWNTGYTPSLNRWTHLAYTYDGSNGRLYVNGNLQATTTLGNSAQVSTTSSFSIGRDPLYNTYVFNGRLSEVRLWDVARSQMEIQGDLYRSLQGTEPHLMAYYPLNGMYNKKVWDFSAYQQVAYTSRFPIGHTNVGVGIQSGDVTITEKPFDASTTVTLTGNREVTVVPLTPLTLADGRGNGLGWSLTVAATPFREVGGAGYTFEPGSMVLVAPKNVSALSPGIRTVLPALSDVDTLSIDEGNSVTLAVAQMNEGMGAFRFTFSNEALRIVINPAYARVDPVTYPLTPTLYSSTLTWKINSGP